MLEFPGALGLHSSLDGKFGDFLTTEVMFKKVESYIESKIGYLVIDDTLIYENSLIKIDLTYYLIIDL
jgi:hypothetical protein